VTGGSSGIGAEIARQAAADDRDVIVVSRTTGPVGTHVGADLSQADGWSAFAALVADSAVGADRLEIFHCAGTLTPIGFAGETDAAAYRANVLLNSAAPQILGDAVLRSVAGHGVPTTLVMITSGAARTAYPGWSAYCAGKAAMDHWVRTVGEEQRLRDGVKVVAIAPGVVDTEMQSEIRQTDPSDFPNVERFRTLHAEGELRDPAAVAARIRSVVEGLESGAVVDLRDL
ncbi:MAG: SDR family NAD(P)-dependent oxidoreductase, partial [Acidimicrobiia bacterium]|nr:SDR family NAD(P)-dependent oxidoreductase [Acidimicrobiia bacterium]